MPQEVMILRKEFTPQRKTFSRSNEKSKSIQYICPASSVEDKCPIISERQGKNLLLQSKSFIFYVVIRKIATASSYPTQYTESVLQTDSGLGRSIYLCLCSFLKFHELVSFGSTGRGLRMFSEDVSLWKRILKIELVNFSLRMQVTSLLPQQGK